MKHPVRNLVATAAIALAMAGCGGSSGTDTLAPADAVRAAVSTTTQQPSSRMTMAMKTDAGAIKVEMAGEGVFDYAKKLGTMSMTIPGSGQKVEAIMTPDTMYMKIPSQGSSYYSLPMKELGGTQLGASDPASSLQVLTGLSDDVQSVGKEDVRGEETTHYRGTYDLKRAVTKLNGLPRQAIQKLIDSGSNTVVPFDAYVDSDGRLRKLVENTTTKVSSVQAHSTVTIELYDFGTPVDVTVPTDVKDGSMFLDALKGRLGGAAGCKSCAVRPARRADDPAGHAARETTQTTATTEPSRPLQLGQDRLVIAHRAALE